MKIKVPPCNRHRHLGNVTDMNAQNSRTRAIELSLLSTCPVRCSYCPQDSLENGHRTHEIEKRVLTPDDVQTIVTNASRASDGVIPVTVHLSGFTEPLLSPHFSEIVDTLEADPVVPDVVMYSTGVSLDNAKLSALRRCSKLKLVNWHITDAVAFQHVDIRTLRGLPQRATIVTNSRRQHRKARAFFDCYVHRQKPISRANNVVHLQGERVTEPVTCVKMTTMPQPVVIPSGDAFACCNDFGLELKLGNLLDGDWLSLDFARVQVLQNRPESNALCFRNCHIARQK